MSEPEKKSMKDRFYAEVYEANDPAPKGPHGWIQWKGTDVCMDVYCTCGVHSHVDAEFAYGFECHACKRKYVFAQHIKLIELTEEQARHQEENLCGFVSGKSSAMTRKGDAGADDDGKAL